MRSKSCSQPKSKADKKTADNLLFYYAIIRPLTFYIYKYYYLQLVTKVRFTHNYFTFYKLSIFLQNIYGHTGICESLKYQNYAG